MSAVLFPSAQVLNCIVDMVEKTRRSVNVLRRCQEADREELNYWRRRLSEQEDPRKAGPGAPPFSKTHSPHTAEALSSGEFPQAHTESPFPLSATHFQSKTQCRVSLGCSAPAVCKWNTAASFGVYGYCMCWCISELVLGFVPVLFHFALK